MSPVDFGGIVQNVRERVSSLMSADKVAAEMLDILRDTHRIMRKLEEAVDRLDSTARSWQDKFAGLDVSSDRLKRLEEAVLNIERATTGVEGAMNALPRVVRERIWKQKATPEAPGPPDRSEPV